MGNPAPLLFGSGGYDVFNSTHHWLDPRGIALPGSEDYFVNMEDLEETSAMRDIQGVGDPRSAESTVLLEVRNAFAATVFVSALASMIGAFPGHLDGGIWPLYVPETHGHRSSQHLFDPYSFTHIGHGIISYYIFEYDDDGGGSSSSGGVGLVKALFAGVAWEQIENTEVVVNLFRQNSGTSGVYRGDSSINVFGDLLSCAIGYNFARLASEHFSPLLPLFAFSILEVVMFLAFRDNMVLMAIQLLSPVLEIKRWQSELRPPPPDLNLRVNEANHFDDVGYWSTKYTSESFAKYKPPRITQSLLNPQVHYF